MNPTCKTALDLCCKCDKALTKTNLKVFLPVWGAQNSSASFGPHELVPTPLIAISRLT